MARSKKRVTIYVNKKISRDAVLASLPHPGKKWRWTLQSFRVASSACNPIRGCTHPAPLHSFRVHGFVSRSSVVILTTSDPGQPTAGTRSSSTYCRRGCRSAHPSPRTTRCSNRPRSKSSTNYSPVSGYRY